MQCECEAKGLDIAVRQAEHRMMTSVFNEIRYAPPANKPGKAAGVNHVWVHRSWVRGHAQDYILSYFAMLTARRKEVHGANIQRITDQAWHFYRAPPHPAEVANAELELKRWIDEDWKASVQRYPEVLEYYYGLVDLSLPGDDEPQVSDPPMSALAGGKQRVRLRQPSVEKRRRSRVSIEPIAEPERRREGRRQGVSFAVPSYSYVQPQGY